MCICFHIYCQDQLIQVGPDNICDTLLRFGHRISPCFHACFLQNTCYYVIIIYTVIKHGKSKPEDWDWSCPRNIATY
jgi:hypothetical protein